MATENDIVAELAASAQRVVADGPGPTGARSRRSQLPGYDPSSLGLLTDLGWLGILVPEEDGGIGLGLPEMAAVVRELEKGLMGEPLLPYAVLGARVLVHGDGPARAALLAQVPAGECLAALALDFNGALPAVTAVPADGGWRLSGQAGSVVGGVSATHLLVPAQAPDGVRLFAVPANSPGVTKAHLWRADDTPLGQVALAEVVVGNGEVLATPAAAETAVARALDETRIVVAAGLLGLSEHMLAMTLVYMGVRKQYGQLIGSFQALQHKAVDLYIDKERAAAALQFGLATGGDPATLPLAAVRAKGRCSDTACRVARDSIQLHGAIGFTDEHDLGLYVKRALTLSAWLGNAGEQRRRFIDMGWALA
ncbi:acyl-CoA dehydrogenase family protein [Nitrospirillum viridazoti]|uniref:Acyl-CoA dehydrogenase n=1 Tax=Nitrospirillum viridazoti CBAmc TaxID=1441467 RepID=A0A248JUL6_9PROT|nr:acyl-CoA dehydrogenase family protein [Nitrospirillum amazonense]ASG22216.1 acyl-CoA dehydrogenase [Nitrospirillum amazonense CBAmc]TWB31019.1 alkylation response protein AidB-like acyl-CoA dehydrogenase [Nitrospirillum amazonense]